MAQRRRMVVIAVVSLCLALLSLTPSPSEAASDATSLTDVITARDKARMRQLFLSATPYNDIATAYYVAAGLQLLGAQETDNVQLENVCRFAQTKVDPSDLESVFYATSAVRALGTKCKSSFPDVKETLEKALEGQPSAQTIFYAVVAMDNLKIKINNETVLPALMTALDEEESILSYGQAFLAASLIPDTDLSDLFDQIEDTVTQADETSTTLYFEDGLKVTSTVISGIFSLAARVGDTPAITEDQTAKFGNYLLSSKYSSSLTDVFYVLTATSTLTTNKFIVPSAVLLADFQPISSSNKDVKVRLTTILDTSVGQFTVKVKSIEDPDGEEDSRNKPMTMGDDGVTYSYPLLPDVSGPGVYQLTISAETKADTPVVELPNVQLSVTVSYQVTVGTATLSVVEKDQNVAIKTISLDYPNSSKETAEADQHSKVVMKFTLLNKETSDQVTVHQAFVRLSSGEQEIFYVATADSGSQYTFELDVAEAASDFGQQSGAYVMSLIVGDFDLENPFSWEVGSLTLKFPGTPPEKKQDDTYKPKPEIEHMFNPREKRPPKMVSLVFTGLVLLPLGLLVVFWFLLGANISNFGTGGIWTLLFHLGLTAIVGLYYCFWLQLNMFQTLKYLVVIGLFTFFTGNRMLRKMAHARQA